MTMKVIKNKVKRDGLKVFAKEHKKEIMKWQDWARAQSGKTIEEMDWENEPRLENENENN